MAARPAAGGRGPRARLQQVRAVAGQAGLAQRRAQPAVPHELPAGRAGGRAAGEAARHVGRLAEEVRVVQRERGHHLHALGLLAGQAPAAVLRARVAARFRARVLHEPGVERERGHHLHALRPLARQPPAAALRVRASARGKV